MTRDDTKKPFSYKPGQRVTVLTPALWVLVPVVHEAFGARDRSQFGHQVMIVSLDDERPLFLHLKTTQTHFIYLNTCIRTKRV